MSRPYHFVCDVCCGEFYDLAHLRHQVPNFQRRSDLAILLICIRCLAERRPQDWLAVPRAVKIQMLQFWVEARQAQNGIDAFTYRMPNGAVRIFADPLNANPIDARDGGPARIAAQNYADLAWAREQFRIMLEDGRGTQVDIAAMQQQAHSIDAMIGFSTAPPAPGLQSRAYTNVNEMVSHHSSSDSNDTWDSDDSRRDPWPPVGQRPNPDLPPRQPRREPSPPPRFDQVRWN